MSLPTRKEFIGGTAPHITISAMSPDILLVFASLSPYFIALIEIDSRYRVEDQRVPQWYLAAICQSFS